MRPIRTPLPLTTLSTLAALALAASDAPAQPSPAPPSTASASAPRASSPPRRASSTPTPTPARRDATYFRGAPPGADPAGTLLWIPRVVFYPFHLVTEYGVRQPLLALAHWAERTSALATLLFFLRPMAYFDAGPAFALDAGFVPMVGASMRWTQALLVDNELRVSAMTGGVSYVDVHAQDRWMHGPWALAVRGGYYTRADRVFYGLGPRSLESAQSRYRFTRRAVFAQAQWRPWGPLLLLEVTTGYDSATSAPGTDPSIDTRFDVQDPNMVPGFGPTRLFTAQAAFALDTRVVGRERTGARLEGHGYVGVDTANEALRFLLGEARLEGGVEVIRPGRVLTASVAAADSGALGSAPVPFTYLPSLGGESHRGFRDGRFVGQSFLLAALDYRYPVWSHLEAVWELSVGNVFGQHFAGFSPGLLTGSLGLGLRTRFEPHFVFDAMLALGSTRFDTPFGVDSVRFVLEINRGL